MPPKVALKSSIMRESESNSTSGIPPPEPTGIVAGLELVRDNQETIRLLLDLVLDRRGRKSVQRRCCTRLNRYRGSLHLPPFGDFGEPGDAGRNEATVILTRRSHRTRRRVTLCALCALCVSFSHSPRDRLGNHRMLQLLEERHLFLLRRHPAINLPALLVKIGDDGTLNPRWRAHTINGVEIKGGISELIDTPPSSRQRNTRCGAESGTYFLVIGW